jgi:hypothetical protein
MAEDDDDDSLTDEAIKHWLYRYGIASPLLTWKQAPLDKAPDIAFRAIASDASLLLTLDAATAYVIVKQAEQVLVNCEGASAPHRLVNLYGAIAPVVRMRIANWADRPTRQPLKLAGGRCTPEPPPRPLALVPDEVRAIWKNAFDSYPSFDGKTGESIGLTVLALGADGLRKLKSPMDEVFAAISARFAARCSHGAYYSSMERKSCVALVGTVQEWAVLAEKRPLLIGYQTNAGTYPEQARMLAFDALSCVELAAELPGGDGNPGLAAWEAVAEMHAYIAVALNPQLLAAMDYDLTQAYPAALDYDRSQTLRDHHSQTVASAAARFALRLIEHPVLYETIDLPASVDLAKPRMVLATVRRFLPNGVLPRRSDGGVAERVVVQDRAG